MNPDYHVKIIVVNELAEKPIVQHFKENYENAMHSVTRAISWYGVAQGFTVKYRVWRDNRDSLAGTYKPEQG